MRAALRCGKPSPAWSIRSWSPPPRACSGTTLAIRSGSTASSRRMEFTGRMGAALADPGAHLLRRDRARVGRRRPSHPARSSSSPPAPRSESMDRQRALPALRGVRASAFGIRLSFRKRLRRRLCAQNRVYREHRSQDVAILPPALFAVSPGGSRRFMEEIGRNGAQQKFPRVVDDVKRDVLAKYARPFTGREFS